MTTSLYLEQYLESLQHLPVLLQRNFKLMRELDERAHNLMRDIDLRAEDMLPNVPLMDYETKKEEVGNIQSLFNKAKEYCDDKVQLAIQTYELVDKQIRRLDADLLKFEAEIQEKNAGEKLEREDNSSSGNGSKKGKKKAKGHSKKKRSGGSSEEEGKKKHRTRERSEGAEQQQVKEVLDMPVDPNEPTYCLCHQVSYGEMIGCDNPDCPIEWFHFACVALTTKPKGKWYCPKCSQDRKKK